MFQQLLVLTHRDQSLRTPTSKQTGICPVSMLKMTGSIEAPPLRLSDTHRSHDKGGGTYPAHLHQLGDHDDAEAVLLPDHPPEVVDHLLLGSCGGDAKQGEGGGRGGYNSEKMAAITVKEEAAANPRGARVTRCRR